MGLFGKKKNAEEILAMIAELPEEERAALVSMLSNETSPEDAPGEESAPADVKTADTEAPEVDAEAPEVAEPAADAAEAEEQPADPEAEPVADLEAEPDDAAEAAEEAPAETEPPAEAPVDVAALLERMEKLEETIEALAQRIGAAEEAAANKGAEEDEDPFGLAFGAEHKSDDVEDELERAKREAGFNF